MKNKIIYTLVGIMVTFSCMVFLIIFFLLFLINRDEKNTKAITIPESNEMQTYIDGVTQYRIINGKLYGRGWNTNGELGNGIVEREHREPVFIADSVVHIDYNMCGTLIFLNGEGELYGVGDNSCGQLGIPIEESTWNNGSAYSVTKPVLIATDVKYALVGCDFVVILKENGKLYVVGNGGNGQLGSEIKKGNKEQNYTYFGRLYSYEPVYVMNSVAYIACNFGTIAAIRYNGELWMWGDNSFGGVGNGIVGLGYQGWGVNVVSKPYLTMEHVINVHFDEYTVYAENDEGEIYAWGKDYISLPTKIK